VCFKKSELRRSNPKLTPNEIGGIKSYIGNTPEELPTECKIGLLAVSPSYPSPTAMPGVELIFIEIFLTLSTSYT
jgi:hypothetical protein